MKGIGAKGCYGIGNGTVFSPVINEDGDNSKNIYVFNDEFTKESIPNLMFAIEKIKQSGCQKLNLFFNTIGGVMSEMLNLKDYLNSVEDMNINIICNEELSSAGFVIMFMLDNENISIEISDYALCMIHLASFYINTNDLKSKLSANAQESLKFLSINDNFNKDILKMLELAGMSTEKIKCVSDGQEVYMSGKEMKLYLKNYKQYKDNKRATKEIKFYKDKINELEGGLVCEE